MLLMNKIFDEGLSGGFYPGDSKVIFKKQWAIEHNLYADVPKQSGIKLRLWGYEVEYADELPDNQNFQFQYLYKPDYTTISRKITLNTSGIIRQIDKILCGIHMENNLPACDTTRKDIYEAISKLLKLRNDNYVIEENL